MKQRWRSKTLGDLLMIQNGYAFDSKSFSATSGTPLIRIRDLKGGLNTETRYIGEYKESYVVKAGDLLVGMDGEFGCYEWKGGKALLNQRVCRLQEFASELQPKFLFYGLNNHLKAIEETTGFTTVKHLSSKQITSIEFSFPPLPEQQRIVAILDKAFEGIDTAVAHAEKNLANARELFESYLQAIFARHAVGWTEKPLWTVCKKITVGHVGSMAQRYQTSGIPFLRSQNVRPFEIAMDNVTFIDEEFHAELKKSQLCPGDLAIVRTGYPGTAAVIPPWLTRANCSDLVIIRPGKELTPHYLEAFFNSSFGKKLVLGKLVGAAQKHFNVTAAKEVVLHFPPAREQEEIVTEIRQFRAKAERLEALYEEKVTSLAQLKQAILAKAFAGELSALPRPLLHDAAA